MKNEEKEDLYALVLTELKNLGVKVPKVKKFKSNIVKQDNIAAKAHNKVFGVRLSDQEWISECGCALPKFVVSATTYLKNYINAEIGLFRKAGSVARQRELRAKLEKGEGFENCEPNDVASLLKQWLRELPEPVVPGYLHDLFIKCHNLENADDRLTAVLMACLLMPSEHLYTLKYLLLFLTNIASNSVVNKMVPHNLAVVMAPNLFSCGNERIEKSGNAALMQSYTAVVELLIIHSDKVGEMPPNIALQCSLQSQNAPDFLIQSLDASPSRTQKKRSGGMGDLMIGIRKFVGNSLTPINNCIETLDDHRAPSSRSAHKRKAGPDSRPLSDIKKRPSKENIGQSPWFTPAGKGRFMNSLTMSLDIPPSSTTPLSHIRRKSFGLLGKKKQKRVKIKAASVTDGNATTNIIPLFPSTSTQDSDSVVLQPVTKMDRLKIPTIENSSCRKRASFSNLDRTERPKIARAQSDQPLTKTKQDKLSKKKSISQDNIGNRKSPRASLKLHTKRSKSPLVGNVKPSPKTKSLKSQASPTPKRSNSSCTTNLERQPFRRNGSTRRSSRRRPNPNRSAQRATAGISKLSIVDNVKGEKGAATTQDHNVEADSTLLANNTDETDMPVTPKDNISLIKRGSTKSSLRRGRPNTVKTGLPSERCLKLNADSIIKFDLPDFEPTDCVFENETEKSGRVSGSRCSPSITDVAISEKKIVSLNSSDASELQNCLIIPSNNEDTPFENDMKRLSIENKGVDTVQDKRFGNVTKRNEVNIMVSAGQECGTNKNPTNLQEEWQCGSTFLASSLLDIGVPACKRESIVQILAKHAGKVQASVQHYNQIAKSGPKAPPVANISINTMVETPKREQIVNQPQFSAPRSKLQNIHGDYRLTRSESKSMRYRKSPLPLPPKFSVSNSTSQPSPLKEVTNLTKVSSVTSPVDNQGASPVLPFTKRGSLKERRNKPTEGKNTPRSAKARRSESSPALTKTNRRHSQRIVREFVSKTPSPPPKVLICSSKSLNISQDLINDENAIQKMTPNCTVHLLEESVTYQVDEWQCNM